MKRTLISINRPSRHFVLVILFSFAIAILTMLIAFTETAGADDSTMPENARRQRALNRSKIIAALQEPTEFEFFNTPLNEVVDFIKLKHKIPCAIDSLALESAGIATDTFISDHLRGMTAWQALEILLRRHRLTFSVDSPVLLITTIDHIKKVPLVKTYHVADLMRENESPPQILEMMKMFELHMENGVTKREYSRVHPKGGYALVVSPPELFREPAEKPSPERTAAKMFPETAGNGEKDEITLNEIGEETVVNPIATMYRSVLVVRAHELDHRRIQAFLQDLRDDLTPPNANADKKPNP